MCYPPFHKLAYNLPFLKEDMYFDFYPGIVATTSKYFSYAKHTIHLHLGRPPRPICLDRKVFRYDTRFFV